MRKYIRASWDSARARDVAEWCYKHNKDYDTTYRIVINQLRKEGSVLPDDLNEIHTVIGDTWDSMEEFDDEYWDDVDSSHKIKKSGRILCGAAISKSKENELRSALYKILKRMWMGETRSKTIKDFGNSDYRALHKYVYEHKTDLFNSKYLQDKIWDYANKQDNSDIIARAMIKMYDGMSENDFRKALNIQTDYKK